MLNRAIFLLIVIPLCLGCKSNKGTAQENRQPAASAFAKDSLPKTYGNKYDKTYESKRKVLGKRSEKEVLPVIYEGDNLNVLRYAYNNRLREHPGIIGWVVFKFHIVSSGKVIDCTITESQIDDTLLLGQLTAEIMKWNFAPVKEADTTVVVLPFCFCS
jgi:hypothetical protein